MNIKEIKIKNFKSLYNVIFCPGNINVFIGANGSGKSSVLEAIGVLSAAMTDRVNNNSLQRKVSDLVHRHCISHSFVRLNAVCRRLILL